MNTKLTRRDIVKSGLIAGALVPSFALLGNAAGAAELPMLDPKDPTASALGFVTDATKVSASINPTYKPGQRCGVCAQFLGKASDSSGGCNIFAGHSVPSTGWCKVWAQKAA